MSARRSSATTVLALAAVPLVVVPLGAVAGVLQWQAVGYRLTADAATESLQAAREAAESILSYRADTVEEDLHAARDRLTEPFLASYSELVDTVVIPEARQRGLSAVTEVAAAASVSADTDRAVALLFIDQRTTAGAGPPTVSPSTVRVRLDRIAGRWLVSGFEPI